MFNNYAFLSINVKTLSYEECQNAIRDSAYAYYYRKQGVQYDQQDLVDPLDLNSSKGRYRAGGAFNKTVSPLFYFPPEDATAQDPRYVVCSTFVENVIYETFKSGDEDIVTISNNVVTAVSTGTATITVTSSNGVSASCEVEIKDPDLKKEVVLEEISDDYDDDLDIYEEEDDNSIKVTSVEAIILIAGILAYGIVIGSIIMFVILKKTNNKKKK